MLTPIPDADPDGNSDILAAMHAVVAMMSVQRGTDRKSEIIRGR